MNTTERSIRRNIFIAGYQMRRGGLNLIDAKKWFDKTYPKSIITKESKNDKDELRNELIGLMKFKCSENCESDEQWIDEYLKQKK